MSAAVTALEGRPKDDSDYVDVKVFSGEEDMEIIFEFQRRAKECMDVAAVDRFLQNLSRQLESSECVINLELKLQNPPGSKIDRIKRARRVANGPVLRVSKKSGTGMVCQEQVSPKKAFIRRFPKMTIRGFYDLSDIYVTPSRKISKFGTDILRPHEVPLPILIAQPTTKALPCQHEVCDFEQILQWLQKWRSRVKMHRIPIKRTSLVVDATDSTETEDTAKTTVFERHTAEDDIAGTRMERGTTTPPKPRLHRVIMEFGGPNERNDNKDLAKLLFGDESENEGNISFGFKIDETNRKLIDAVAKIFPASEGKLESTPQKTRTLNSKQVVVNPQLQLRPLQIFEKNVMNLINLSLLLLKCANKTDKREKNLKKGKTNEIMQNFVEITRLKLRFKNCVAQIRNKIGEEINRRDPNLKIQVEEPEGDSTSAKVSPHHCHGSQGVNPVLLRALFKQQRAKANFDAAHDQATPKSAVSQQPSNCSGARPKKPLSRPLDFTNCFTSPLNNKSKSNGASKLMKEPPCHDAKTVRTTRIDGQGTATTTSKRAENAGSETGSTPTKGSEARILILGVRETPEPRVPQTSTPKSSGSKKNKGKKNK